MEGAQDMSGGGRTADSASVPTTSSAPRNRTARSAGRDTYRPASFKILIDDAANSLLAALEDGYNRLEVDFPVGPTDSYKGASDMYIDTNVQLAIATARKLRDIGGLRVHILVPDQTEFGRSNKMFKNTLGLLDGITMGYLTEDRRSFLGGLFGGSNGGGSGDGSRNAQTEAASRADVFMAINASTIELADLESYVTEFVGERPVISWCMELDTLRADLGLLGFPPKELQYRFLSLFKPVFYIRQRDYSKSVAVAPFIINYSGALFREYPGPWQAMLRQDNGIYACVAEDESRYTLGSFKEELMASMGLNTEEEGSPMAFFRRGYKTSTWWEDAVDEEESNNWRR